MGVEKTTSGPDNGTKDDRKIYRQQVRQQPQMIEMTSWVCGEVDDDDDNDES